MKHIYLSKPRISFAQAFISSACFFLCGFFTCILFSNNHVPHLSINSQSERSSHNLFLNAWRNSHETCSEWISIQRHSTSYLDVYVVGSQKGATSQMSKNLYMLGVRHENMVKEWHYYSNLDENGQIVKDRTVARPLPPLNLTDLRLAHYLQGFPDANITADSIPLVDNSPIDARRITMDMTVEYLHSDRSAFLAHTLTPHAKIIITIRDPLERALSQYNMNIRNGNLKQRSLGLKEYLATPEEFDKKVRMEIAKLARCGYHSQNGLLDRKTSALTSCLFNNSGSEHFDDTMYVTRGLYHVHIQTWRDYFPAHRMLVVSFQDLSMGSRQVYNDLSQFLCIRPYPEALLSQFESEGSSLSFGQQAAKHGLKQAGFDTFTGNDRYLSDMLQETRVLLRSFYAEADKRLISLLGPKHVYWAE